MEPALTWSMLITACGFPCLGWWIRRLIVKKDEVDKVNQKLWQDKIASDIDRLEDFMKEMRSGFDKDISKIEECMASVETNLHGKVDADTCEKKCDDEWRMINHHKHDSDGKVVIV